MKKTLITLLILIAITLLAAVFYKNLSNENSQILIPIKKPEIEKSPPAKKPNETKLVIESTELNSLSNDQNETTIDLALANDITNGLLIKDRLQRIAELVRLADVYPENELLQFLASNSCIKLKSNPCDPKRFADRLLSINPKNIIGKELLISDSLNSKDYETALSILETIDNGDTYSIYFSETIETVESSLRTKPPLNKYSRWKLEKSLGYPTKSNLSQLSDGSLQKLGIQIDAIGVAAAQAINGDVIKTCSKEVTANVQAGRWINACNNYGQAMENSKSLLGQSIGLGIQARMQSLLGNHTASEELRIAKERISAIRNLATPIMTAESFFTSGETEKYFADLKKFGELEAMRRLIERQPKN